MLLVLVLATVALVHSAPTSDAEQAAIEYAERHPNPYPNGHPLYDQPYWQGDIRFLNDEDKNGRGVVIGDNLKWPNNIMPYTISDTFTASERAIILDAMRQMEENTEGCVTFVERTNQFNYVRIFPNGGGCWSLLGRVGIGGQPLSLDTGCVVKGIVMHELLHAFGFYHEQARGDRDDYVIIHWDNIPEGLWPQFEAEEEGVTINHLGTPYDYDSVMHYGAYAGAIDRSKPTITPLDPDAEIGQIEVMSFWDTQRLLIHSSCVETAARRLQRAMNV